MMELLFLPLLFIVCYADSCGWATQYYEWSQPSCELMKVEFHRSSIVEDQYLVNNFVSRGETFHLFEINNSGAIYTPGFWVGRGETFHGIDGNPENNGRNELLSLQSTFPRQSMAVAGHSFMAGVSGVDFGPRVPLAYCNGVRFTTDFGIKLNDPMLKPSSVSSDYKISLDVSLGTSNPNVGVIVTYNGVVVPRTNAGRIVHDDWADGLDVPYNFFSEIRVNPSMGSQQLSVYFFKLGPDSGEEIVDLFVSPFWVNAIDGEAIFNQHSSYAYYFHTGTTYSLGFRYGWESAENIGELINDGHEDVVRFNRFGGTVRSFDSFFDGGVSSSLWCKERPGVMGPWFLPSTTGYLRVEEQGIPSFSGTRGKLKIKVRPVADLSSGKLKWGGYCYKWTGGEKVWATADGDYSRVLPIGSMGRLVMDPCGHPDYLGFVASPRSFSIANFKCVSDDGSSCASVTPRVGNVGYCYGTINYASAFRICDDDGGHIPQLEEISLCCEENDRCSIGRDLIWVNLIGKFVNFDATQTSADFWTRVIDESSIDVLVAPSGASVNFFDNDGVEFTEEFIVPNMAVEIEVNLHAPERDCDDFIMLFDYTAINGQISSHYSWHVSKSFGVYVTLYDLNNVDPSTEFGDLAVVAHGFAGHQNINFYSPAGFSSPDFGVNTFTNGGLPAMHGSYGATFVTSIYHIIDECCSVHVSCGNGSECEVLHDSGSEQLCFNPSSRKFRIEVSYRKLRRSAATDIALYWWCPSHLVVDDGDDSLVATRPSRINVLELVNENDPPFNGIIPNNFDKFDGRIIPAGCLDAREKVNGGLVINRVSSISFPGSEVFRVALLTSPEHSVRVTLSGPFSFNRCTLLFTVDSWETSKIVFASVAADTEFMREDDTISMTCSSEDSSYDGVTHSVVPRFNVGTLEVPFTYGTASCQMDFFKRPLNSWSSGMASEMDSSDYVGDFVVFGPTIHIQSLYPKGVLLHVHARAEPCGLHSCVTAVGIQHGRDIYAVYKAATIDSFSFNVLSDSSSASVYEEFGCWKLVLPDNNVIHICPNTNSYLDINIDFNVIYHNLLLRNPSGEFEGSCLGNLVVPQNSVLKYPVEVVAPGVHSLHVCENGLPVKNGIDSVSSAVQRPMPATSQVVFNPYDLELQGPLECVFRNGALSSVLPRAFSGGEFLTTWCEGFNDLFFYGANDALRVSLNTISYFHSTAYYKANFHFFADSIIKNNPRFCPFGKVGSNGCTKCPDDGCFAPVPQPRDGPTPCTSKHSVLLDESSGKIIKCYMGICEYSSNGFAWQGLPTDPSKTPYCLSAISNGPVLWGFTVNGEEIKSSDFGQSWTPGSYDVTEKVSFTYAHSDSFDNISPTTTRHSSLSVPENHWFSGLGSDRWWLTPDDLCVYSNRLAVTKSLIYCVRWWCDCIDFDTWSSSFGVDTLA